MNTKIRPTHLRRRAVVYVRQSTARQVMENVESTDRQYALVERATSLGWPPAAVEVVDEDLGQSGASTAWRPGFKRIAEQVTQGKVGAIFALDVSRFARSSADWHRLLELCRWTDVLIIDEQATFDPTDPNDGLLLGFKGQMSEAEKNWLKLRMHGARLNKARRGELKVTPPSGYVWDTNAARLRLDPDEEVQRAIQLAFRCFRTEGSGMATVRYFHDHDLLFPVRRCPTGPVAWVRPQPTTLTNMLRNPIYTGAYVYGRRESRPVLAEGRLDRTRTVPLPMDAWKVYLPDRHPAYITWEEYVDNQQKLKDNRASWECTGAPGEGAALLQGLAMCGKCGYRMSVGYQANRTIYGCREPAQNGRFPRSCWTVTGGRIEQAVVDAFLHAAQPPELDLSLAVTREAEHQAEELDQQWRLRVERARYEAKLAERRYKAIDPDNRNVARTVEAEWEQRLAELAEVEGGYEAARRQRKVHLTDADRARVLTLARDLAAVWHAPTTTHAQRKTLLRTLITGVTLTPIDVPTRQTRVQILWEGGAVSELVVDRPRGTTPQRDQSTDDSIRCLTGPGVSDAEISQELNARGALTPGGRPWTPGAVRRVRRRLSIRHAQTTALTGDDGLYSTRGVAERFGVTTSTVSRWCQQGLLQAAKPGSRRHSAWYRLDDESVLRIEEHLRRASAAQATPPATGGAS